MSKKKGPLQQLGVPVGFRLTNNSKELLVRAAVKKKFEKKLESLLNREFELMNCITEWRTPSREALVRFQTEYNNFTGLNETEFMDNSYTLRIDFSNRTKNKHSLKGIYSTGLGSDHISLGYDYSDYSAMGSIITIVEPGAILRDAFYCQRIAYRGYAIEDEDLPQRNPCFRPEIL